MRATASASRVLGALWLALSAGVDATAHEAHEAQASDPPPPPARARFAAPEPGSYELPAILGVGPHRLLDEQGESTELLSWGAQEFALVSFVFLSCGTACPTATATLQGLDDALVGSPLEGHVELVTVSFDPERDTPAKMAAHRKALRPQGRWRFLTAAGLPEIAPVLADFGQHVGTLAGSDGEQTEQLQHVLKVFLLDGQGQVRNIYSTGFLDVRLMMNDLLTLSMESASRAPVKSGAGPPTPPGSSANPS